MKQIIELAQEQLSKEQSILRQMQNEKEVALNDALRYQSEIPVQENKVNELNLALQDLYKKYGYLEEPTNNGACVASAVKGPISSKKPSKVRIGLEDIKYKATELSKKVKPSIIKAALVLMDDDYDRISDLEPCEYEKFMDFLNSID